MRRSRRFCCKLLLCIVCLICIFHILLSVHVHMSKSSDFLRLQQNLVLMNRTDLFNKIWNGRELKNLSLPSSLVEFQNFYNKHNRIDPSVVMYGKITKELGWFNRTYLEFLKNTLGGNEPKNLTLPSDLDGFESFYNMHAKIDNNVLQYGHVKNRQGYLTIGIPTVKRRYNGDNYLFVTLKSLISNIDENQIENTTIVIFMADPDDTWNVQNANKLYSEFQTYIDGGLIQIIKAPEQIYPYFSSLKQTKQDSAERVRWRSKQNIDFAFLMLYCQNISTYYLQLEDDLMIAPNFIRDIETFVSSQSSRWVCLEFSTLGFIGKMFQSSDLRVISSILLTYYSEKPCDLLLGGIIRFLGQSAPIHSPFSLFQHIGKISSLRNKMMPSIDRLFKGIGSKVLPIMKMPKGDHPPAKFITDMKEIPGYPPENVYKNNSYFWASYPRSKQYFRIVFEKPLNISRLVISTGENINKTDFIENGILKVGANEKPTKFCSDLKKVGVFVEGEFDSLIQGIIFQDNVDCLHIEAKKGQKHWLIIRDIEIFENKIS